MATAEQPRIAEEKVIELRVNKIVPSKANPRHVEKDAALLELSQDIVHRGVQVPIIVRECNDGSQADWQIVVGHRRHLASKIAKLETIPAIVRKLTDEQAYELQIIENMQREDMHPLDEAEAIRVIFERQQLVLGEMVEGADKNKVAAKALEATATRLAKPVSFVAQRMKLNDLVPKAKEAFRKNEMMLGHAVEVARLEPKDQARCVTFLNSTQQVQTRQGYAAVQNAVTVDVLRAWIRGNLMLDLSKAPFDPKDATLSKQYGACTTCPHRTSNSPSLFGDIAKGDLCTVASDFFHKRNVTIDRKVLAAAKERGVAKLVRVGFGSQWGNREDSESYIPVDVYVGEFDSKGRLVAKGDECEYTKPGIAVYKARDIDAKYFSDVNVCMAAVDGKSCAKHKNQSVMMNREQAAAQRDKPEMRDAKRVAALKETVPLVTRDFLIKAVCLKAKEAAPKGKLNSILEVVATQMRAMLYGDRHRELAKNVLGLDPKKFKAKLKATAHLASDYQAMADSIFKGDPLTWLVACASMNSYVDGDALQTLVKTLNVNEKKVAAEVKAGIDIKIEAIKVSAKRREERAKAKPKTEKKNKLRRDGGAK